MRQFHIKQKLAVLLCLACTTLIFSIGAVTYAAPATASDAPQISAEIYPDVTYTDALLSLTPEGATLSGWTYDTDRYLLISLDGLSATKQYRLTIQMDPILYLDLQTDPTLDGATVTFERNEALPANKTSSYPLKPYSLANLTYLFDRGTTEIKVPLAIAYDNVLWDKMANSALGNGTDPLLRVIVEEVEGESATLVPNGDLRLLQATSGIKRSNPVRAHLLDPSGNESGQEGSMSAQETCQLRTSQMTNVGYEEGHYYENLVIELKLPTATYGGKTYTMVAGTPRVALPGGTADYTCVTENGMTVFTFTNIYYQSNTLATIPLSFPSGLTGVADKITFSGTICVKGYDGIVIIPASSIKITLDNSTGPKLAAIAKNGATNLIDMDTVQYMGMFGLSNTGEASGKLTLHLDFDDNDTGFIGITTVRLMGDGVTQNLEIRYTLADQNGQLAFGGQVFVHTVKINKSMNFLLTRNLLPQEHRSYYFKSLEYDIATIKKGAVLYSSSATKGYTCCGTIWGYMLTDSPTSYPIHKVTVTDANGAVISTLSKTITVSYSAKSAAQSPSYGIRNTNVSANTVMAGDPIVIGGQAFVINYPYTSVNCLNDIRIGLLLPNGISVNRDSIKATFANGTILEVDRMTQTDAGNGKTFWIIEFKPGQKIGYASESLGAIKNGASLTFSIQLNTDKSVIGQTIELYRVLFVAGLNRTNGAGGSWEPCSALDSYDLNGNGSTTDKIGCVHTDARPSFEVVATPASLSISSGVRAQNQSSAGETLLLTAYDQTIYYDFSVVCDNGGTASDFYFLIPITKISNSRAAALDFIIQAPVNLQMTRAVEAHYSDESGARYIFLYTTVSTADYDTASALPESAWWTTLPDGVQWSDVTFVKVLVSGNGFIPTGSDATISVPLQFEGTRQEYIEHAGMQIEWKSCGYYYYDKGALSKGAHGSSESVVVTVQYIQDLEQTIHLTAAKDRNPQKGGSTTDQFTLDAMLLPQSYTIQSVTVRNLQLVSKDSDRLQTDANIYYAITAMLDGVGSAQELLTSNNVTLGTVDAHNAASFLFEIFNGNALSEVVTERTVELEIVGRTEAGIESVIIRVCITVHRELAPAEATDPSIKAGKEYVVFSSTNDSVKLSCDASFTAQYIADLYPSSYSARILSFATAPTVGTTITMIDWTDPAAPHFYYYTVTSAGVTSISLSEFLEMGNSGARYTVPTSSAEIHEALLFIVSFPSEGTSISSNSITLTRSSVTGNAADDSTQSLEFSTVEKRSMSLTTQENGTLIGSSFHLTYTVNASTGEDTRYPNKGVALLLTAVSGTMPADAVVILDGQAQYRPNARGQIILPLPEQTNGSYTARLELQTAYQETVTLRAELLVSATGNATAPMMGERVARLAQSITLRPTTAPSFAVLRMSDERLTAEELSHAVALTWDARDLGNATVTLEIQRRDGLGYVTQTDVLNTLNGNPDHKQGVFDLPMTTQTLEMKFSEKMPVGSYRILFRIFDPSGALLEEIPYYFLVE